MAAGCEKEADSGLLQRRERGICCCCSAVAVAVVVWPLDCCERVYLVSPAPNTAKEDLLFVCFLVAFFVFSVFPTYQKSKNISWK